MLKQFEKRSEKEDKGEVKAELKELRAHLNGQQQRLLEAKLPVIVLVEGWAAAGKGTLINVRGDIAAAEANRAALQAKVDEMTQKKAELEYDIEHAGDPEIIAEVARSKLGLVLPGEKVFYDLNNQ